MGNPRWFSSTLQPCLDRTWAMYAMARKLPSGWAGEGWVWVWSQAHTRPCLLPPPHVPRGLRPHGDRAAPCLHLLPVTSVHSRGGSECMTMVVTKWGRGRLGFSLGPASPSLAWVTQLMDQCLRVLNPSSRPTDWKVLRTNLGIGACGIGSNPKFSFLLNLASFALHMHKGTLIKQFEKKELQFINSRCGKLWQEQSTPQLQNECWKSSQMNWNFRKLECKTAKIHSVSWLPSWIAEWNRGGRCIFIQDRKPRSVLWNAQNSLCLNPSGAGVSQEALWLDLTSLGMEKITIRNSMW